MSLVVTAEWKCGMYDVQMGAAKASLGKTLMLTRPSTTKNILAKMYVTPQANMMLPKKR